MSVHEVRLVAVDYAGGHRLHLRLQNGICCEIDFAGELWGPVFEPLSDVKEFAKAYVSEFGVLTWPSGADWDPETLYSMVLSNQATYAAS